MANIPRQANEEDPAYRVRQPVGPPPLDSQSEVEVAKQDEDMEEGNFLSDPLSIIDQFAKDWDTGRQGAIDTGAQLVDDVVTGGLQKLNIPGSMFIGDRARNISGFAADMVLPEAWELPILVGAGSLAVADGPFPAGDALLGLKYGSGVASRAYRAGKKVIKKPIVHAANIIDEVFEGTQRVWDDITGWSYQPKLATANGVPVDTSMLMSKSNKPSGWDQIPPGNRDYTKPLRKADKLARVNKEKIRKYVQEFGGTEEDVIRIWKEHVLKEKNVKQSRTWLNEYWDKLINYVDSAGNLNEFAIKNIDGKPTLVNTLANGKVIKHPFEVDHSKAKALMTELGIEGADFHENLDIVYSVFNRAKSDFGVIPDDILRATGQSTSLRELVQRSLDTDFNAKFTRVPERLRVVARQMLLEDVLDSVPIKGKPGKIRQQIIDKHLKFWDKNSELIVQLDDYIPEEILKDVDFFANPQQGYESLLNMGVLDSLKPTFKKRIKKMADQWVTLSDKSKTIGDYVERTGGRQIKKKYNK